MRKYIRPYSVTIANYCGTLYLWSIVVVIILCKVYVGCTGMHTFIRNLQIARLCFMHDRVQYSLQMKRDLRAPAASIYMRAVDSTKN